MSYRRLREPGAGAAAAKGGIYHVVKSGESLYRIGKAYDLSYAELARVNKLRDPNQIRVGQKLFIPGAARQLPVEMITPADSTANIPVIQRSAGRWHRLARGGRHQFPFWPARRQFS